MPLNRRSPCPIAAVCVIAASISCGSRTNMSLGPFEQPVPECTADGECAGAGDRCAPIVCQAGACTPLTPTDCDDGDPCTLDSCEKTNGACGHSPATSDLDLDGHRAPLEGKKPGEAGSCGDDCDDTSAAAFPGGIETCDGMDNDCNGVVDDGAAYRPTGVDVRVSSARLTQAFPGGLAQAGADSFLSVYMGQSSTVDSLYLSRLDANGSRAGDEQRFTLVATDAYGGPIVWIGDRYAVAWSDRRDQRGGVANYEVYFNLVGPNGSKIGPDVRVTEQEGFSENPAVAWTGRNFVLVWQDDGMNDANKNELYARRMSLDGELIGNPVKLTSGQSEGDESPAIAWSGSTLGVAWTRGDASTHRIMFRTFDQKLAPASDPVELTGTAISGVYPSIIWNQSAFVVAFYDSASPLRAVYGAVRGQAAEPIVSTRPITSSPRHSRYPTMLPYGDRFLLVWSDDKDDNRGYELYSKMLDNNLKSLTSEDRLTYAPGESITPTASFSPDGKVGILFRDDRDGSPQVYFTGMTCTTANTPPLH
jgi:hypothetical protein